MNSKKHTSFFSALLPLVFCFAVLGSCKIINYYKKRNIENTPPKTSQISNTVYDDSQEEMRGLWVPFIDLEINSNENTQQKFENKFQNIISKAKNHKINTLIVHVRSHGDALYPSKIFPWSHLLTGKQGIAPSFDPLKYMVKESHKNNLRFHAWINPLRIKSKTCPNELSKENPCFKNDFEKHTITHVDGVCYNPGCSEIQNLVIEGVKEIVENYNVDGIHFDDYFYPEKQNAITKDLLFEEYSKKEKNPVNESEWRKNNITEIVKKTYQTIKQVNPNIQFGISPPGIIEKCYKEGADVNLWLTNEGYLDYICPQIYWSIDFEEMPFEKTALKWKNIKHNPNIKIYSGLALYKIGTDLDKNTWKNSNDIIKKEVQILRNLNYNGFVLYSSKYLDCPETEIELKNLSSII